MTDSRPRVVSSTIIPTVGRPSLARAVESVLGQETDGDFEVIVVNDSGRPLVESGWAQSARVRVLETLRRERSVARNAGAAAAHGRYLHFLDDDDWLTPGALQQLWSAARWSSAAWVYGHAELVDSQGAPFLTLRQSMTGNCFVQAMAGEWVPLQASLVDAEVFFTVGGFNPLVSGPEDIDLLRRVSLRGALASTPHVVAHIEWRTDASTTDYGRHPAQSRWAREKILDEPGVLGRMRGSARSSYWHGRIVRIYATSAIWNIRRRRALAASSRAIVALASVALAGSWALTPQFWRAMMRPHTSVAFAGEAGTVERQR